MSAPLDDLHEQHSTADRVSAPAAGPNRRRLVVIGTLFTVVLLTLGFLVGYAVNSGDDRSNQAQAVAVPAADSVDVGFLQDMITHHNQAVVMAHFAETDSTDPEIRLMAYDLLTTQQGQIGTMRGWLLLWQQPEQTYRQRMSWMGTAMAGHGMGSMDTGSTGMSATDAADGAVMPGMATNTQLQRLSTLRGTPSDIFYLQLMIRHHEGGTTMMQYAAAHAGNPILRNFAGMMVTTQIAEVSVMTQMLALRGAQPLPAP